MIKLDDDDWVVVTEDGDRTVKAGPYLTHMPCVNASIDKNVVNGYVRYIRILLEREQEVWNYCAGCQTRPSTKILEKIKFIYENSIR